MKSDRLMMLFLGLFIGLCLWVLIGSITKAGREAGKYQVSTFSAAAENAGGTQGWWGYVIVDTTTGKVIDEKVYHKGYQ